MFDMTSYEMYVFTLCCIVFAVFTVLFSVMIGYLLSLHLKLIKHGILDEKIITEYQKQLRKKQFGLGAFLDRFVSIVLCAVMCSIFAFSVYMKVNEDKPPVEMSSMKVVQSSSMAKKHEKNTYLIGVDNQVQAFDMVKIHPVPEASKLQLYDVIMYRSIDDTLVLHRIVKIEEPNQYHPTEYWYTTQGDAVEYPDGRVVQYSQILGIYQNERIPMVGSFVMFMQSPAGYLCILLVLIAVIATPIMERKLEDARMERLQTILASGWVKKYRLENLKKSIYALCGKHYVCGFMAFFYWCWLKKRLKK